jgi:hypothetical protein
MAHEISENEYKAKSREEINQNYRMVFDKKEKNPQPKQRQRSNYESNNNTFIPPRYRQDRHNANNYNNFNNNYYSNYNQGNHHRDNSYRDDSNMLSRFFGMNDIFGNASGQNRYRDSSNDNRSNR